MVKTPSYISSFLKKLAVLLLYASLFSVRLSASFYERNDLSEYHHLRIAVQKPAKGIHVQGKDATRKSVLRVSKRFQPENGMLPLSSRLPVAIVPLRLQRAKIGQPTAYLLFSLILSRSLRGPPAVA